MKVTWHVRELSEHVVAPNEPGPDALHVTRPAGTFAGVVLSVTVAVHVTDVLTTAGLDTHETFAEVVSPALTVTVPLDVSRLNIPLQVAGPGIQSFTLELNDAVDQRFGPRDPERRTVRDPT